MHSFYQANKTPQYQVKQTHAGRLTVTIVFDKRYEQGDGQCLDGEKAERKTGEGGTVGRGRRRERE